MKSVRETVWDECEYAARHACGEREMNTVFVTVWKQVNEPCMVLIWDQVIQCIEDDLDETD